MSGYDITTQNETNKVSAEIIDMSNSNNYSAIERILESKNADVIMGSAVQIFSQLSGDACNAVRDIYATAITKQVEADARELQSKDKAIENFNNSVNRFIAGLDTKNTEQVQNVMYLIEQARVALNKQLDSLTKPSLFARIFGR